MWGQRMSCPARRMDGSGLVKGADPALEEANNVAFAALLAAREAEEAKWRDAYSGAEISVIKEDTVAEEVNNISNEDDIASVLAKIRLEQEPIETVPLSDTCFYADDHCYKVEDPARMETLTRAFLEAQAARDADDARWMAAWKEMSGGVGVSLPDPTYASAPVTSGYRTRDEIWMPEEVTATATATATATESKMELTHVTDLPVIEVTELK